MTLRRIRLDRFSALMVGGNKLLVSKACSKGHELLGLAPWLDMLMTCIDDDER